MCQGHIAPVQYQLTQTRQTGHNPLHAGLNILIVVVISVLTDRLDRVCRHVTSLSGLRSSRPQATSVRLSTLGALLDRFTKLASSSTLGPKCASLLPRKDAEAVNTRLVTAGKAGRVAAQGHWSVRSVGVRYVQSRLHWH